MKEDEAQRTAEKVMQPVLFQFQFFLPPASLIK